MLSLVMLFVLHVAGERLLDLSYPVGEHSRKYIGYRPFERSKFHKGWYSDSLWVSSFDVAFSEHTSTHMDAPIHTAYGKNTVDEIPIEDLLGPAIVIDMEEKAALDDNAELGMDDLQKWTAEHGPLPDRVIIFVRTGWGAKYHNRTAYFGTDTNDTSKLRSPGLGAEVSEYLAGLYNETGRRVLGVGIDTMSLDTGNSSTFPAHLALSAENIYLLENVANLQELPAIGAEVTVLPIKFTKGTGGPTRILARIPDSIPPNNPAPAKSSQADAASTLPSPTDTTSNPPRAADAAHPRNTSVTSVLPSNTETVPEHASNTETAPEHASNTETAPEHASNTEAAPEHASNTEAEPEHASNTEAEPEHASNTAAAPEHASNTEAEPEHPSDIETDSVLSRNATKQQEK